MNNLRSTTGMTGYIVRAIDGDIGKLSEFYFDDGDWRVRYFVVNTGRWLPGGRVLLPRQVAGSVHWEHRRLSVVLTRDQVRSCPNINTDKPVARQLKAEKKARVNWPLHLAAEALVAFPEALQPPGFEPINKDGKPFDPHLRTTSVVTGLALRARDGLVGRIVDFIVHDGRWDIRYIVVALDDGARIAVPPNLVKEIRIEEKIVSSDLRLRDFITSPSLDPATLFTWQYEEAILHHYQRARQEQSIV